MVGKRRGAAALPTLPAEGGDDGAADEEEDVRRTAPIREQRRGGDAEHVTLGTDVADSMAEPEHEILDVDAALKEIGKLDPRLVRVEEMRYFGCMKDEDIAQALGLTHTDTIGALTARP